MCVILSLSWQIPVAWILASLWGVKTLVKQGNLDILHQRKNFVEDVSGTYSQSGMLVTTERNSYENSKYCI